MNLEGKAGNILVMISAEDLEFLKKGQARILELLEQSKNPKPSGKISDYISAQQFMNEVNIKRWKFDQLIAANKIKTLKKKRKIYVPISEVARYFSDPSIQ